MSLSAYQLLDIIRENILIYYKEKNKIKIHIDETKETCRCGGRYIVKSDSYKYIYMN